MPTYKKKRHNRLFSPPKKNKKLQATSKIQTNDIEMSSKKNSKSEKPKSNSMRIVTGKKLERSRKFKAIASFFAILLVIFLLLEIILPAGVIQTVANITDVMGTGSYPINIPGSESINTVPMGNYYFCLTDTHLNAFSNSGKQLFSEAHGFEKPILKVSKGKVLLFNQGGTNAVIYNLDGPVSTIECKKEIIAGDISDSGYYALVTYSEKYASAVNVYNKFNKVVYEWYSAKDTINNITLSSNGKKIALSTFNSADGVFNSKVNIINYKTATPEYTKNYDGTLIYDIKCSNNSRFYLINSKGIEFIKWSNYKTNNFDNDYPIALFRRNSSANISVFRRESDKTDNQIVVFAKNGKVKSNIRYKGIINDIQVKGSNIYIIGDTEILVLDFDGKIVRTADYGFGGTGISVTSANTVAVVFDNEIKKIKLNEKG